MADVNLQSVFYGQTPYGKKILTCIQCGTCSASCPLTDQMDHAPREIFALIRDGEMTEVLSSNTPWYCVSCYQCMARCPRQIPVTDMMYTLKQMALSQGLIPKSQKMPDMYHAFSALISRFGRVTESLVMALYGVRHPLELADNIPLAVRLFLRNRLLFLPQQVNDRSKLETILSTKG